MGSGDHLQVDIVLLAAGRSSRMGAENKLLKPIGPDREPMIRRIAGTALASEGRGRIIVVLGHDDESIRAALNGLDLEFVRNAEYAGGLSTSLRAGMRQVAGSDGVMVLLADQPLLTPAHLSRLIAAFREAGGDKVVAASDEGRRRNPVILPKRMHAEFAQLKGDCGAGAAISRDSASTVLVEIGMAASLDTDTPEMFEKADRLLSSAS